jgi:hypothetical protein
MKRGVKIREAQGDINSGEIISTEMQLILSGLSKEGLYEQASFGLNRTRR